MNQWNYILQNLLTACVQVGGVSLFALIVIYTWTGAIFFILWRPILNRNKLALYQIYNWHFLPNRFCNHFLLVMKHVWRRELYYVNDTYKGIREKVFSRIWKMRHSAYLPRTDKKLSCPVNILSTEWEHESGGNCILRTRDASLRPYKNAIVQVYLHYLALFVFIYITVRLLMNETWIIFQTFNVDNNNSSRVMCLI